jgi:hypothetical protein
MTSVAESRFSRMHRASSVAVMKQISDPNISMLPGFTLKHRQLSRDELAG